MKKHLIAAAVAAAVAVPAMAQNVSIYGTMDIGYTTVKSSRTGNISNKVTTTANGDGGLSTSLWGLRGTEDLGGGLKAGFNLEWDLVDIGTGGNAFGARRSFVSLGGNFGSVQFGRDTSAIHGVVAGFVAGAANNTVGSIYSAGYAKVPNRDQSRPHGVFTNDMISYSTPNINGFVGRVDYAKTSTDANGAMATENKETGLSVRYTQGPLALGAAYQNREGSTAAGDQDTFFNLDALGPIALGAAASNTLKAKTTALGASYNLGPAQPFILHVRNKWARGPINGNVTDFAEAQATEVGLRVPFGSVMAFASFYNGEAERIPGPGTADLDGHQIGATYALSKRTTAYLINGQQKTDQDATGLTAANRSGKTSSTTLGIRHTF